MSQPAYAPKSSSEAKQIWPLLLYGSGDSYERRLTIPEIVLIQFNFTLTPFILDQYYRVFHEKSYFENGRYLLRSGCEILPFFGLSRYSAFLQGLGVGSSFVPSGNSLVAFSKIHLSLAFLKDAFLFSYLQRLCAYYTNSGNMRKSPCSPMTQSPRPANRSCAILIGTIAIDPIQN